MIAEFHFLRPWWFLALLALILLVFSKPAIKLNAWSEICDSHLLERLMDTKTMSRQFNPIYFLCFSLFFLIIALAGPVWHQLPVPTYKPIQPKVIVLDMSEHMLNTDLTPDRLSRAKFKLHDLLSQKEVGQFGMVVYTSEPFVVSPLTDDGQTISALLTALTPDIMPVSGHKLEAALTEAEKLIEQAGYNHGQILVLTSDTPTAESISTARKLAQGGIKSSILPMLSSTDLNPLYNRFAQAGEGMIIPYSAENSLLDQWLHSAATIDYAKDQQDEIPSWRDEGRWFLIPALLLFLPVFRKGWLQRMTS